PRWLTSVVATSIDAARSRPRRGRRTTRRRSACGSSPPGSGTSTERRGDLRLLLPKDPRAPASERGRRPPVPTTQQPNRGRHEKPAHDGGADHQSDSHTAPDGLDDDKAGGGETEKTCRHDRSRRGDEPTGTLEPDGHRQRVVGVLLVLFADTREEQNP